MFFHQNVTDQELRIRKEFKNSQQSKLMCLSNMMLSSFPSYLFNNESFVNINRLDISFNNLSVIPNDIKILVNLKEIWLNNNPIKEFPIGILELPNLGVIDIRNTKISNIPPDLASMKKLYEVDWRNTPFSVVVSNTFNIKDNDLPSLVKVFSLQRDKRNLEEKFYDRLQNDIFPKEMDRPNMVTLIRNLVRKISEMFPILDEFQIFIRRANTLLPEKFDLVNDSALEMAKSKFVSMQRETQRKRMSAEVEIRLRNIYFDKVERSMVEEMLAAIYSSVKELEDIEFLVKYASQILPSKPEDALDGALVWANILDLQSQLTAKRDAAITSLAGAMLQLYPEQEPHIVKSKAIEVSAAFRKERFSTKRELNILSQITAEAIKVFPPDFISVDPVLVYAQAQQLLRR